MAESRIDMLDARNLTGKLVSFALPIVASGVVQQSFNSVDVAVVGRYVGSHALAAVGSNGPVIGLIINLFVGIAIGANVIIANYIGRSDEARVAKAVATTMLLSAISGIVLLVIGLTISRPILELMGTPDAIIDSACRYLRIYSLGFPAMLVYNFGSAILRSVGDTKRPFYCLVFGGVVNIILNLVLVLIFGMGVEGVAIATVVSNIVSAIGVVHILQHENGAIRVSFNRLNMYRAELSRILRIGVPAGIQGMVFSLSNIFIQSAINSFGPEAVAGSAAALNYE
ncbi:MAG: MATE family efflux transporter, partial [Muribaculaceae bacterium]|nr:MATE family efflux transporter [Muribaculaceae bacterium]